MSASEERETRARAPRAPDAEAFRPEVTTGDSWKRRGQRRLWVVLLVLALAALILTAVFGHYALR